MCDDMGVKLIAKVPLEPQLLITTEKGACYVKDYPDSVTAAQLKSVIK